MSALNARLPTNPPTTTFGALNKSLASSLDDTTRSDSPPSDKRLPTNPPTTTFAELNARAANVLSAAKASVPEPIAISSEKRLPTNPVTTTLASIISPPTTPPAVVTLNPLLQSTAPAAEQ
ncbi:hypothetical protein HDV05_001477 [Chytridiales sp. JEL 0842]|nr:hypothetical protein HDV05_001477 [Chytridiales sp. JEL 0842]